MKTVQFILCAGLLLMGQEGTAQETKEVPVRVALSGHDPKSCLFLNEERTQVLGLDPVFEKATNGYDAYRTQKLRAAPFRPYRSYEQGNPAGLDRYRTTDFMGRKIKQVTSYSLDRDAAPMCLLYENGEAHCNEYRATGRENWENADLAMTECDVFFLDKTPLPPVHEWVREKKCTLKVSLKPGEKVEKIIFSDRYENYGINAWGAKEERWRAESIKTLCYLNNSGELRCMGSNDFGIVGTGDRKNLAPLVTPDLRLEAKMQLIDLGTIAGKPAKIVDACMYNNFGCGIMENGRVKCWGSQELPITWTQIINDQKFYIAGNKPNQMGDNLKELDFGSGRAKKIDCSVNHMCALFEDGSLRCAGSNLHGQLGHGEKRASTRLDQPQTYKQAEIPGETEGVDMFTQTNSTCVILASGHLSCFGENMGGILGHATGDKANANFPKARDIWLTDETIFPVVPIEKGPGIVAACLDPVLGNLATNLHYRRGCVAYADHTLKCWRGGWENRKPSLAEDVVTVMELVN